MRGLVTCVALVALVASVVAQRPPRHGRPDPVATMRVLAVGDSITAGAGSPGGYRSFLQQSLRWARKPVDFVGGNYENSAGMADPEHEGHGGWKIEHLADGHPEQRQKGNVTRWIRESQPTHVLVMAGTNNNPYMSRQEMFRLYNRLLDRIYAASPRVKVAFACMPRSRQTTTGRAAYEHMGWQVAQQIVVQRKLQGYKIAFADTYRNFVYSRHLWDNYHPNRSGYARISTAFDKALRELGS